ncbi:caspase family protein (plasmid) [Rhizobium laguerreae]|uniref:caspase family protein n=1 Tax=Rhizobium laguerreae TaxID=1076926 RepID=UPI001E300027|nr:caspase family protein [Rhizobium laguerreae]UFW67789.1 caspase family protein [Rhizobium laguerreae]
MVETSIVHDIPAGVPATHVFLIGISDYPHLDKGSGTPTAWDFGLGQLSSPTASARRLAEWFINEFDCPRKPLATVSLVLSEPGAGAAQFTNPKTATTYAVPRGTKIQTRNALIAALAKSGPDDQLIFYFSGHGLSAGLNDFYLLRDFGEDPNGPLDAMINYVQLMASMKAQLPSQQFFVFDGCRETVEQVEANPNGGSSLLTADPQVRLGLQAPLQCSLKSTERDALAYGKKGAPSVCAQAFERALRGAAGKRSTSGWNITSARICEAMADFQTLGFGPNAKIQQAPDLSAYKDFAVRGLPGPPQVPVFMRRKDGGSLQGAAVTCRSKGAVVHSEPSVKEIYWEGALSIGEHDFEVVLAGGNHCQPVTDAVSPTHLPIDVEVA